MTSRPPERGSHIGDDHLTEKVCATCDYWRPHAHYPYVGLCTLRGVMTLDEDSCPHWTPLKIREGEFYWCSTCKTRITGSEVAEHLRRGHRVHRGAYIEPDIREELYSVF